LNSAVSWEPEAVVSLVELARSNTPQALRILNSTYQFAERRTGDAKKLSGVANQWRLRVGDWRVIFSHTGYGLHVLEVVNRRDAYR
jgi:mRNA-degrading endonuclease RelE of RelBE toxin-antitoxin system